MKTNGINTATFFKLGYYGGPGLGWLMPFRRAARRIRFISLPSRGSGGQPSVIKEAEAASLDDGKATNAVRAKLPLIMGFTQVDHAKNSRQRKVLKVMLS